MIVYRVYNENGGYTEYSEIPQGVQYEIIDKTPTQEEIQQQQLEQKKILKQQQYEELLQTDWYVVRFVETGIEIPEEILQQRQAIREKYE
jgi:hypothetical protein